MIVNPFLTQIAKTYLSEIKAVYFNDKGKLGAVFRFKGETGFRIEIDHTRLECVHHKLFVFFHELGHIVLGHCDNGNILKNGPEHLAREKEDWANAWALNEMDNLDSKDRVKPESAQCVGCMVNAAGTHLRPGLLEEQSGRISCNRGHGGIMNHGD